MPSWQELMSMEVSWGAVSRAKSELLKEMIERSSGMEIPFSIHTRSNATARISSLTTMAVGRSFKSNSSRMAAVSSGENADA